MVAEEAQAGMVPLALAVEVAAAKAQLVRLVRVVQVEMAAAPQEVAVEAVVLTAALRPMAAVAALA